MNHHHYDFSLLHQWLNDKDVLSFIEGPSMSFTYDDIVNKYSPRALGQDYVVPCIIEYQHKPIGYIQFYPLQNEERQQYEVDETEAYGLDLFIGESDYWNQGIGTMVLKLIIKFLFNDIGVKVIYIDPQTWNVRAIRSYEKCGFQKVKILYNHELFDGEYKDNQIMKLTKNEFVNQN